MKIPTISVLKHKTKMLLEDFLKDYPYMKVAKTKEDGQMLLELYNSGSMAGSTYDLSYDRSPDFFKFVGLHDAPYYIFMVMDEDKLIGSGTFVIRKGWKDNKEVTFLYNGDLRIKAGRSSTRKWRKFYKGFLSSLNSIEEFKDIESTYAVIISDNIQAKNTLEKKFNYNLVTEFTMRNILFSIRFFKKQKYIVSRETHQQSFEEALNKFYQKKFLGYKINLKALSKLWFTKDHYGPLSIKDSTGQIHGGAILWSPRDSKKIIVHTESKILKTLIKILNIFFKFPNNQEELRPLYLSHVFFKDNNKNMIYNSLIDFALRVKKEYGYHVVAIQDFEEKSNWSKKYLQIEKKISLYLVDKEAPKETTPCFEISLA